MWVCVWNTNLVSGDEVFPFALALVSASAITLFLHPGRNHLPQKLITFSLHEIRVEFGPNHQEIPGFLHAPLRKPIAAAGVGAHGGGRVLVVELLLLMMPMIHIYEGIRYMKDYWGRKKDLVDRKDSRKKGLLFDIIWKGWCENMVWKLGKKEIFLKGKEWFSIWLALGVKGSSRKKKNEWKIQSQISLSSWLLDVSLIFYRVSIYNWYIFLPVTWRGHKINIIRWDARIRCFASLFRFSYNYLWKCEMDYENKHITQKHHFCNSVTIICVNAKWITRIKWLIQ